MLMSSKNKKYTKNITNPRKRVQKIDFATGVFSDEKVQKRKRYSVAWEHVITTGRDTSCTDHEHHEYHVVTTR